MRDLGVFTLRRVPTEGLVALVASFAARIGQPVGRSGTELVVGSPPDPLYVHDTTEPTDGYFDEGERTRIVSVAGFDPAGYVSVHFASTDDARVRANELALEISRVWKGIIDYSGAGGRLGVRPDESAS